MKAPKLYVVVREDMPPGDQAVQAIHAARQFAADHPEVEGSWFRESNHIAFLSVPDLRALDDLLDRARRRGIPSSCFTEPDMGGARTAAAMPPEARRICSGLPKALRGVSCDDVQTPGPYVPGVPEELSGERPSPAPV